MNYVIHLFLGTACAGKDKSNYPLGEKHAYLLYLRAERGSEYNDAKAREAIASHGWVEIIISKAGTVELASVEKPDQKFYCMDAIEKGSALVVYEDPIHEDDPYRGH